MAFPWKRVAAGPTALFVPAFVAIFKTVTYDVVGAADE
jgi:hypothetical protein